MRPRLLLILFGLTFLAAACAPAPQIRNENFLIDTSFLTGEPCDAPCWRNITPGETEWQDALTLIEDDATLDNVRTNDDEDTDRNGAAWERADGDPCCQMLSEDGETVSFIVIQTTPDATLGQVIDKYGEPTYIIGESLSDDQGVISLFYPEVPMFIYAFVEGEIGAISPASEIVGFGYLTEELMQFVIDTSELHTWDGYQTYSEIMDREFEVTPSITVSPSDN
jgi:hypothetical protein